MRLRFIDGFKSPAHRFFLLYLSQSMSQKQKKHFLQARLFFKIILSLRKDSGKAAVQGNPRTKPQGKKEQQGDSLYHGSAVVYTTNLRVI